MATSKRTRPTTRTTDQGAMPWRGWLTLSPRSLRLQMAVGSALVALAAILTVALTALAAVAVVFHDYQRTQLSTEVSQIAQVLGDGRRVAIGPGDANADGASGLGTFARQRFGVANLWVMDAAGQVIIHPLSRGPARDAFSQDGATVTAALRQALQGQASEGALPGTVFPPFADHLYAAAPIYLGGATSGPIVGAVALSTPARPERNSVFTAAVSRLILLSALGVAMLAALAAALFSRRLTQPLAHLTTATSRMAAGDYAARVDVAAPDELHSLATTFNEMAAALQRDIGELRRQEQLRRELVANVSHELATPLTAIQGFTEALLDGVVQDPAARTETTRLIAREAARLRRLVNQLRQVALFEAGAQALERAPLYLPTLVEQTLIVLASELERKQITLVNQLPADLPLVFADGDRLTEILLNLIDNALRYTPTGGRIEVAGAVEGDSVQVSIADTGPGIAPPDRQRIFDRFYRADPSRSSATGGSGLGLAIVRALVEAHGGTIRVDERPGGGACFAFTLPISR